VKDANEYLMAGTPPEEFLKCLDTARDFAPDKVRNAADFADEFERAWTNEEFEAGIELPWDVPVRIRPSELTVWTGVTGSGKSTLIQYVMTWLMAHGERALIASLETKAARTLKKMSQQAWGGLLIPRGQLKECKSRADRAELMARTKPDRDRTLTWLGRNLWIYNHAGIVKWRELRDDMRWARRRHGITQFVIDNFMRLGIPKDDYAQQADAITAMASDAQDLEVHIHAIVHQNKSDRTGKLSISGAQEIIGNAHNIMEVWRNEEKGQKLSDLWGKRKSGQMDEAEFNEKRVPLEKQCDGKFIWRKQRDAEGENTQDGSKMLWFLWQSQQYVDHPPGHINHRELDFVNRQKEEEPELPEKPPTETTTNQP
jgi:twinkle protein